jgi:hypothetical protein
MPQEDGWKYPHATREEIQELESYFRDLAMSPRKNWKTRPKTHALDRKEAKPGEWWPSVPPHLKQRTQDWFDAKVQKTIAERGGITEGKRRSLRAQAARQARDVWSGNFLRRRNQHSGKKRRWNRYLAWLAEQQREEIKRNTPKTQSRVLEIG